MFNKDLTIAFRNLWKSKFFSAINVLGVTGGIAAFMLIMSYLRFEYSFDDFHVKGDRIYRVPMEIIEKSEKNALPQTFAFTFPAVAPALKRDFPEVEEVVRLRRQGGMVRQEDLRIIESGTIYYVDPSFFSIFSYEAGQGDLKNVFKEQNDAVITATTAEKYFGQADPINKILTFNGEDYIVKAVLKEVPVQSHFQFNILFNYDKYIQLARNRGSDAQGSWEWSDFYTYILLKPEADVAQLQKKLPDFAQRHMGDMMQTKNYTVHFALQPLSEIHTHSKYDYEMAGNGDYNYLRYLGIAAVFILLIAWVNYINLTTAKSLERSKEIGIRKVIGAQKAQLVRLFLTELFLINFIAVLLAFVAFYFLLPHFSNFIKKDISKLPIADMGLWALTLSAILGGATTSGIYPAWVLSNFQPAGAIKSTVGSTEGRQWGKVAVRKSLVLFQFIISIVLIAGAIGFYRQLSFMSKADLGLNVDQTLVVQQSIRLDSADYGAVVSFVNQLNSHPDIYSVAGSTSVPGVEVGGSTNFSLINAESEKRCRVLGVDEYYIPAYELSMVVGRNFSNDIGQEGSEVPVRVILNETAAKLFGFSNADAIGKRIKDDETVFEIIGILKDYHHETLQHGIDPIVFYQGELHRLDNFSIKINTENVAQVMNFVQEKWKAGFPESPFRSFFVDERFDAQYNNDRLFSSVLWMFTLLAVVIASLGLIGLSQYTLSKKRKEIAIRKVLGSTIGAVYWMITREYLVLILLAGLPAIPIAYYFLNNWISGYAFRISLGWYLFLLPLAIIATVFLVAIFYQSLRAANENPVESLKNE